ncbi:MAG TPA: acyltransferase [Xanthobacteraceae bacterium]|nr:acyltransferase [Xanthobacteraceae bacterium]
MSTNLQLAPLTGLRGVAAYSVLFAHTIDYAFTGEFHAYVTGLVHFGMSLFFVLSGFVICYGYSDVLKHGVVAGSWRFFVARFARLYPLYLLMLVVSLTQYPYPPPYDSLFASPLAGLSALTLTQSWFNVHGISGSAFGQSWSISTEWFFYGFFLFICAPVLRIKKPAVWLASFITICFIGLVALFSQRIEITAIISTIVPGELPLSAPPWMWLTYFSPYIRVLEFIAGVLACRVYFAYRDRPANEALSRALMIACTLWLTVVMTAAAFVTDGPVHDMLVTFAFAPALAPALVVICLRLPRAACGRPLIIMGEISYSVYALQFFIFVRLSQDGYMHMFGSPTVDAISFCAVAMATTTILAFASFYLFETPARKFLRAFLMNPVSMCRPHRIVSGSKLTS